LNYIHIRNLERFHPGYKDRELLWAKIYFSIVAGDPDFELIPNEIDKWRFIAMVCLELRARKPLPNFDKYWSKQGFNLKKRGIAETLSALSSMVEYVTEDSGLRYDPVTEDQKLCTKRREEKRREYKAVEKRRESQSSPSEHQEILIQWNCFAKEQGLSEIQKLTDRRLTGIKNRIKDESFDLFKIFEEIKLSSFLQGQNDRGWKVGFDFIFLSSDNFIKILEGKYRNGTPQKQNRKNNDPTSATARATHIPNMEKFDDLAKGLRDRYEGGN